jgi:hypothetical protein
MKKSQNIFAILSRFVTGVLSLVLFPWVRVINFPIGWDTLHPLAPYSYGGTPRKEFLRLYYQKGVIATVQNTTARYGDENFTRETWLQVSDRSECIRNYFNIYKPGIAFIWLFEKWHYC